MTRILDTDRGILALFLLLSLVFTYPLPIRMFTHVPGWLAYGWDDSWAFVWVLWLVMEKALSGSFDLFFTDRIFYPDGVNLIYHTLSPANGLIGLIPNVLFGPVFTLNFLLILTFVLSAYGAYRLCYYVSSHRWGSIIAGLVFAFCPYRMVHTIEHLNLASTQWIPFFFLFLLKTRQEPSPRNAIWISLFFLLTLYSCWYYGVFLALFGFMFILFSLQTRVENLGAKTVLFSLVTLIGIAPILWNMPESENLGNLYTGLRDTQHYGADLLGFFIPSSFHPVLGSIGHWGIMTFRYDLFEGTVYLGIVVLFLIPIGFYKGQVPNKIFWVFTTLFFFLATLGPYLKVAGRDVFTLPGQIEIYLPLPFNALYRFPLLDMIRAPGRYDIMFLLCASVAIPFAIRWLMERFRFGGNTVFLLAVLILFEYLAVPIPTVPLEINLWHQKIAQDNRNYSILDIPVHYDIRRYQFEQTVHGKDLVVGHVSRTPKSKNKIFSDNDILVIASRPGRITSLTIRNFNRENFLQTVERHNIRYIVLHKNFLHERHLIKLQMLFQHVDLLKKGYEDKELLVYEVRLPPREMKES